MSRFLQVLAACYLMGLSWSAAQAQPALEQLREQGYARIAIANEPPITQVKSDGTVTGAAVEIARAVLKKIGVDEVIPVVSPFGAMIPGLQAKRFDLITAGLFMRPQRCEAILFSEPDICDAEGILIFKENADRLKSYADIAATEIRLGVIPGSHGQKEAKEQGVKDSQMSPVPDIQAGLKLLQDKRIDAYLLPVISLLDIKSKSGDENLVVVAPIGGGKVGCAGAAFRKEDKALRDAYDVALKELKESGEFSKILTSFGIDPNLALNTTREQSCGMPN